MERMGTPLNLKSADGNTYVTRYIIPGHDFQLMIIFPIQFLKLIIQIRLGASVFRSLKTPIVDFNLIF